MKWKQQLVRRSVVVLTLIVLGTSLTMGQTQPVVAVHSSAAEIQKKPDEWFTTEQGIRAIDFIISKQLANGGWEKGYQNAPSSAPPASLPYNIPAKWDGEGTIDNGFTYTELRVLARAYNLTHRPEVLESFNRGLDFLFTAQYPNGGWPQRYPPPNDYGRDITFNDNAMTNVMRLLKDIADGKDKTFAFVDPDRRAKAKRAFEKGLECVLKTQIVVNGQLTGWCQQYTPDTLLPDKARSYELPSIAADETAGLTMLLMDIENPSPQVQRAVHAAAAWLQRSKILGLRLQRTPDPTLPKGFDVIAVEDPNAEPLWARFYEIETNRPFFCGRDGVKKYSMNEIEPERRAGYAWLRPWGKPVLERYEKWKLQYPSHAEGAGR
ncbi:pectate lyase [Fontivita pretiosa]|uniref:pectate lyase n=1 Tax=Fontivita pretiosa TaxID=2989684 RepID=UPI003D16DCA9